MAVQQPVAFPNISRRPGVVGGEPTINGTRIAVRHIVEASHYTPEVEELLMDYPALTRELIAEAFAYYEAHRAEIDRDIAANDAAHTADDLDVWRDR